MELKPGYKQTEVGVIPENWDVIPLGRISYMRGRIGWQGLKQSEFTMNSDEPFLITGMNFRDGKIQWGEVYHVSWSRYEVANEIQLRPGDVLMTKDGTIGKMLYVDDIPFPGKATLNSHLLVFRPFNGSYIPKFLFYQLNSKTFIEHIEREKSGSTFFGITQQAVGKYNAYIPTITEQTAIAEALSDADTLIESLEQLIAKKRLIKQGAMQELLTGKRRLPGFKGEWEEKRLREVVIICNGGTPSTKRPEFWNGDIHWCIPTDVTALRGRKYLTQTSRTITAEGLSSSSAELIPPYSVVMTSRATIGECAINTVSITTNQGFKSFIPNQETDVNFLYYYLLTKKKDFIGLSSGSTFNEVGKSKLEAFIVAWPNKKTEQTAIAAVLSDMDAEIALLEEKLDLARLIKQGMMQELLTGRIRLV